ncbi:hypothetical protein [Rhodococcus koreensis]|nr:hypothetical protein [Rhodococcus koreensis]
MRKMFAAGAVLGLLPLTGCNSSTTADTEAVPVTSATDDGTALNKRGAVEVALGEPATVRGPSGALILEVTGTALSAKGCPNNTTDRTQITKQKLTATVSIGNQTSTEWLWPSDFYYVDASGKVTRNLTTSDATPCPGAGKNAFIDLPANSSADGFATLDIPNTATVIGYQSDLSGSDVQIEWKLPTS